MQFGMPTLIEIKLIESCAELCRELGLDFIELNMILPEYQADRLDETLHEAFKKSVPESFEDKPIWKEKEVLDRLYTIQFQIIIPNKSH